MAVLCPDLLFGSKIEGGLRAAGHTVTRYDGAGGVRAAVAAGEADVLVVDLTDDGARRAALVELMRAAGELQRVRTIGFYSHVDQRTRRHADRAGFDLVVPRSRMAREMGTFVQRMLSAG